MLLTVFRILLMYFQKTGRIKIAVLILLLWILVLLWRSELELKSQNKSSRFEVFTAVQIRVEVFCVVTPCSVVVGY